MREITPQKYGLVFDERERGKEIQWRKEKKSTKEIEKEIKKTLKLVLDACMQEKYQEIKFYPPLRALWNVFWKPAMLERVITRDNINWERKRKKEDKERKKKQRETEKNRNRERERERGRERDREREGKERER